MENTLRVLLEEVSKLFVDIDLLIEATSHEFDSYLVDNSKEITDCLITRVLKQGKDNDYQV